MLLPLFFITLSFSVSSAHLAPADPPFASSGLQKPLIDLKCAACEFVMWTILKELPRNATSNQIKLVLDRICNATLPGNLAKICNQVFDGIPLQKILSTIVWFLGTREYGPFELCGFFSVCKTKCCLSDFAPEQTHLALTARHDQMSVTWVSSQIGTPFVLYGTDPAHLTSSQAANTSTYTSGGWVGYIHTAVLSGLAPDTRYFYQVGDPFYGYSSTYYFRTYSEAPRPSLIAHIADMGSGNWSALTQAALGRWAQAEKLDLLLHSGDIAYADGVERYWDIYFREAEVWTPYVPYMASPGNHEIMYHFDAFKYRFNFPHAAAGSPTNLYYSFDFGWVHVVTFNADGPATEDFNFPVFKKEELAWLKADLIKANQNRLAVPWIVFITHRNLYCYEVPEFLYDCSINTDVARLFLEDLLVEQKVDLLLTGHVHNYQRMWPTYKGVPVKNYTNPPYPVQIINGGAGNREGIMAFPDPYEPPEWLPFSSTEIGFGLLTVQSPQSLMWQYISSATGQIIDSMVITKNR